MLGSKNVKSPMMIISGTNDKLFQDSRDNADNNTMTATVASV